MSLSTAPDQTDLMFWKAYAKVITQKIGFTQGSHRFVFICSDLNRSIPASRFIPRQETNACLYDFANGLLSDDSVFYTPGGDESYFDTLKNYLEYVQIKGGHPTEGAQKAYDQAKADLDAVQTDFNNTEAAARTQWGLLPDPRPNFQLWADYHAASYSEKLKELDAAKTKVTQAGIVLNGPMFGQLAVDRAKFDKVEQTIESSVFGDPDVPGYTMSCMKDVDNFDLEASVNMLKDPTADPPTAADVDSGVDPTLIFHQADYGIDPQYRNTMDKWAVEYDPNKAPLFSTSIDTVSGQSWSYENQGFSSVSGSGGVSIGPFRIGGSHGETKSWMTLNTGSSVQDVKINMSWQNAGLFNVAPGSWEIPDIRRKYPNLLPGAPAPLQHVVRPVQIFCVSGLAYDITFTGQIKTAFDSEYTKQQSTSGGLGFSIGIFGVDASAGVASGSSTHTHNATYDASKGQLHLAPTNTWGNATLMGIVGKATDVA